MSGKPRVYVGRLHAKTRERDLEKFFRGYGKIADIMMKRGFAFIEFDDVRDAEDAVRDLDGKELLGDRLVIEMAHGLPRGPGGRIIRDDRDRGYSGRRGDYRDDRDRRSSRYEGRDSSRRGPPTRTDHRLYADNLSSRCSWQDLKDFMRQAGEVTYAEKIGSSTGVVEFASSSDKKAAMKKLDGLELFGKRVHLRETSRERSRSPRDGGGDRDRSSRRRSRTRSRSPRSRSRSPRKDSSGNKTNGTSSDDKDKDSGNKKESRGGGSRSRSKSRSLSRSRSRSRHDRSRSRSRSADVKLKKPVVKEENGKPESTKADGKKDEDEGMQSRSRSPSNDGSDDERARRNSGDNGNDEADGKDAEWEEAEDD